MLHDSQNSLRLRVRPKVNFLELALTEPVFEEAARILQARRYSFCLRSMISWKEPPELFDRRGSAEKAVHQRSNSCSRLESDPMSSASWAASKDQRWIFIISCGQRFQEIISREMTKNL